MKLRHLQAIQAVITAGTVTRAAELLGLTQPAVSKIVAQLEDEFGMALFGRRHGRLELTPEGQMFFRDAQKILTGMEQISALARDISALRVGTLKIAALPALGYGLLPGVVRIFSEQHPKVRLTIDVRERQDFEEMLSSAQYDIGFATLPMNHQALTVETLFRANGVVVAPPGHAFARKRQVTARDLADQPFISVSPSALLRYWIDEMFGKLGIRRRLICETHTTTMVCHLVAAGLGVSIVHPLIAQGFGDRLLVRPFRPALVFEYGAILPKGATPSRLAQTLLAIARKEAKRIGATKHNPLPPGEGGARQRAG